MDRRNFLKAGAVAGGSLGLGAVGCGAVLEGMSAAPVPSLAELSALDMDGFLKRLDTSLGFIQSSSNVTRLVPNEVAVGARKDPRFEDSEALIRGTLRSLLLTSSFTDLPEAGRMHPGMQARLWNSMQEMDDAVLGMNKVLTSLTPTERADVSRLMREDPTVTPRILDVLDEEGVKAGVNEKRRAHMRELGKHSCFRLRQSTSLFIDEYDDKVQKVVARDSSVEAIQRRMMAQMGEDAFWQFHARQFALMQAWQQVPGVAQGAPPPGGFPPGGPAPGYGPNAPVGGAAATATATAVLTATAGASGAAPQPSGTGTYVVYPFPPPGTASAPPGYGPGYGGPGYGPPGYPPGYGNPGYVLADPEVDEEGRSLKKLRRGNILLGVGGGLLGLGAISAGIATALTSNESTVIGGLFVWTLAGVLGLGGIGLLIAGGIIRARA